MYSIGYPFRLDKVVLGTLRRCNVAAGLAEHTHLEHYNVDNYVSARRPRPTVRPQRSSHGRIATKTPGRIHTEKERHEA